MSGAGPRLPTLRCGKINSSNRSRLSSVGISRQHARFAIFSPQKGERVSNRAPEPEFGNLNTLPLDPPSPDFADSTPKNPRLVRMRFDKYLEDRSYIRPP